MKREAKQFLKASEVANADPRVGATEKFDKESLNRASLLLGEQKILATYEQIGSIYTFLTVRDWKSEKQKGRQSEIR